jgi:hypothetical protein
MAFSLGNQELIAMELRSRAGAVAGCVKFDDAAPGSMILSDHAARSMICPVNCTVAGSSMTRFGLDDSQKNHIVANDRRKRGTIAIDRDSMAAN